MRGGATLSKTQSTMIESSVKCRTIFVDRLLGESKNCLIHGPGILLMNARYWENFVLSIINIILIRTVVIIPYQEINLTYSIKIFLLLIMWWMKSYYMKIEK